MELRNIMNADRPALEEILKNTKAFRKIDVEIALELIDDRLCKGVKSDYQFIVASEENVVLGYACYGLIPLTDDSFDLYWIVASPAHRGKKTGSHLMACVQSEVIKQGGLRIYADTSSGEDYSAARRFYIAQGFVQVAHLSDFYRKDEAKVIYCLDPKPIAR